MTGHGNNSLSHVLILQKLSFIYYVKMAKTVDDSVDEIIICEKFIDNVFLN